MSCSLETYLHQVGKQLFYETYQSCLNSERLFDIIFERPRLCDRCEQTSACEMSSRPFSYSLTNSFKNISLEKRDDIFIPDILLKTESGEKLYVEIVVTHYSTQDKMSSGVRLIEIKIESEDDFALIRSCKLSEEDNRVKFINFDRKIFNSICPNYMTE